MSHIKSEVVPSKVRMMAWITEIYNQGIRRPGYPADDWVEKWIKNRFERIGLEDVTLDPVPLKKWEAEMGTFKIWPKNKPDDSIEIPCFPLPYTTPTDGIEAELCSNSEEKLLGGKIGVYSLELIDLPTFVLRDMISACYYFDPQNEFDTLTQLMPFGVAIQDAITPAMEANALAFVGILSNYPWETQNYYVPYDAQERNLPSVWVSPNNGKTIVQLMSDGPTMGRLSYYGKISEAVSHNITGALRGVSDEWIVIGTHHDGPWSSAVEDASGVALVLAQAEYWSHIPMNQRPFNLLFLMNCGHMAGGAGIWSFIERNKKFLQEQVLTAIHLEHVSRDVKSENGKMIPLETPTVRWWFTSRINVLEKITQSAFITEKLDRSIVMPPDGFPPGLEHPPTDGGPYHTIGVPLVSLLAAPPYLFDPADTPDKIHQDSLEPITRAVIRIINALRSETGKGLREQVREKDQFPEKVEEYAETLLEHE